MKSPNINLEERVEKLFKLGKKAKKLHKEMAKICVQIKPLENKLKYHFPFLAELYDNLIKIQNKY